MANLEDLMGLPEKSLPKAADVRILIDRYIAKEKASEEDFFRLSDSVQTAFFEGEGTCYVNVVGGEERIYSDRFELDGLVFEEPSVNLFSFNNPYGACRTCDGFGKVLGLDPDLVLPDRTLSVYDGAIGPWKGDVMRAEFLQPLLKNGIKFNFPIHRAIEDLTPAEYALLWKGNKYFTGLDDFFADLERQAHKIQYRVMLSRFRGKTNCPDCRGTRLRKDASYVLIGGKSIQDLVLMPLDTLLVHFKTIQLSDYERQVAKQLLTEIESRLTYLNEVGLGYLTLNRLTSTLSGGEYQRIKLATSLGSALVGSLYVLDEPSIGLHPRDTTRLVQVLRRLRDVGNTVLVVEHEEEIMRAADQLIDIGPLAGSGGGNLIFQGLVVGDSPVIAPEMLLALEASRLDFDTLALERLVASSPTVNYLTGKIPLKRPESRRSFSDGIIVHGARENNLKNLTVRFPLQAFTAITGVSGSGKSTLVTKILYPALARELGLGAEEIGKYDKLSGDLKRITSVEFVDQNPIGRSSRSNPVTFVKAWDVVRQLYADQPLAKQRGYKPSHYSFNVDGGRCEACQGEGQVVVPMQFMADLWLPCESCGGKRFKQEVLEVLYNGKNAAEVLALTVDEAMAFFKGMPKVSEKLKPLQDVGLGYITLGQSSSTLSGGEAQRVKLASFLSKGGTTGKVLFIFDEPTTGLHFADIAKLLFSIHALVDQGHTVLVIEHNLDMIYAADHIIDLGPEGGIDGGQLLFEGTPELMLKKGKGHTADYLRKHVALK
jgi:excinuclease ABC subunit A